MPTILDAEQLAEHLQIHPESIRRLTRDGSLPCHKVGGSVRYSLEDVLARTQANAHSDDLAVDEFAKAMHAKMAAARAKGREGWDDADQCTLDYLADELLRHAAKGDPVDVANLAMMLFARGAGREVLAAAFSRQEKAR